jgi:hypothetical protein
MSRLRSIVAQSPAIVISCLALVFALGSGASYAAVRTASAQPSARVTFHTLTLLHGWKSSQHQYDSGNPAYAERDGIVYLSGSLHTTSGSGFPFAVLPKGNRPSHYLWLTIYTLDGTSGTLEIQPNGSMYVSGGSATGYASLAGVSFALGS